ncbi:VgrG-related protein [Virgisporangium aurantiacum]|uniref:Type IV secretion protein Rhs n=1 Tax=Virgisporangium aurantiacum TaxID=175570 RepID=A0A8J3Z5D9_9ACTN|nr:VgrG-related protein [Virgisporangium aurantiacum]GIJ55313.1 type IV secretion protein Rhs [Virgisporangium aurantiacum]
MAENQKRLDGVVITADGRPLPADLYGLLSLVRVEESVQLPDYFAVHFDDPHFELFDKDMFTLGTRMEIAFRAEGDPVLVTSGELTAVSMEPGRGGRHELVLAGLDLTHRMARAPKSRSFQSVTDGDVASRIAGEYGLEPDVDSTGEVHEYLLQVAETDYAFLRRRAARIGFDFWISEKTFHFKKGPRATGSPPPLRWGANLKGFSVRFASGERCDEVQVRGWDPLAKKPIVGRASEGELGTDAPAGDEMHAAAKRAFGRVQRSAGYFPVADQAQADALAQAFLLRSSGAEVVLRGEASGDPLLAAGAMVKVEGVGTRLAGNYRVTSVEHLYGAGRPYVTRIVCGGKEPAGIADLLVGGQNATNGASKSWGGLVVGIVTNNNDPEKLGRIKVTFPTLSAEDESAWARVATLGGGPKRGMQWLPEVDDEVLVGFEHDDQTRPVVLGGMWNRTDAVPLQSAVANGKVNERGLVTRIDSRLLFTDEPTPSVHLSLGGDKNKLHLEQKESQLIGEQKLVVEATDIEVTAKNKLVINAAEIEITATGQMTLTGKPIKLN